MNQPDPQNRSSDTIRSEINQTRDRMDHTIDALSERLRGRHLVDEVLGYFRSSDGGRRMKDKVTESAGSAVHTVVDAAKKHPLPALMIGAGLAWLIYETQDQGRSGNGHTRLARGRDEDFANRGLNVDEDLTGVQSTFFDPNRPEDDTSGSVTEKARERAGELKDELHRKSDSLKHGVQEGVENLRARAAEGLEHARERARQTGSHLRERTREIAQRTRHQVVDVTQQHPLESGVSFLALGLLAGLLTPTPEKVRATVAPTSRRVRERVEEAGSELMERGKRVVRAATDAAKNEAESQGLTPEAMAERAREAARPKDTAHHAEDKQSRPPPATPGTEPLIADQPDSPETIRPGSAPPASSPRPASPP